MSAIFELFRDDAGSYRFQLKSAAGDVIALSDGYQTRSGAEEAIETIRQSAATAFVDDRVRLAPLEPSLRDGD